MTVKGYERLSCVTSQKWVTWHLMCCTWPRRDTRALLKQSLSGSRNVQTRVIDEKPNKISQPVLNETTNRTGQGRYVSSTVGDGSHGWPRRPEFKFQFREGITSNALTQTWCSSYVNRDSGLLNLGTESKTFALWSQIVKFNTSVAKLKMGWLCALLILAYWLIMQKRDLQMWQRYADVLFWCFSFSAFKKGSGSDRRNDQSLTSSRTT